MVTVLHCTIEQIEAALRRMDESSEGPNLVRWLDAPSAALPQLRHLAAQELFTLISQAGASVS